jgi:hypothetical protein
MKGSSHRAGLVGKGENHHAMNYNIAVTAEHLRRSWGLAVADGFEGIEGPGNRVKPA